MREGIFGWSYPPGAANDPNAPYNQTDEGPCDVCGQNIYGDCICQDCPVCGATGDPACYDDTVNKEFMDGEWHVVEASEPSHGMIRSFAQVALRLEAERLWEEDIKAENKYYEELEERDRLADEYWASEGKST